jgi:primosomal protein N'
MKSMSAKQLKYPPYYYLVLVKILSKRFKKIERSIRKNRIYFETRIIVLDNIVLGPSTSLFYKINNITRFQCIIKYKRF